MSRSGQPPEGLLSADATALYEWLLRSGSWPMEVGREQQAGELLARGLAVQVGEPPRLVPVAPVAALTRNLADATSALAVEQQRLVDAHREVSRLQQRYTEAQLGSELSGHAAVIRGDAIAATVTSLIRGARTELLHINTGHYRRPLSRHTHVDPDTAALAMGLRIRCVYATSFLRLPRGEATVRHSQQTGAEVRVSDEVPLKLYLADDRLAVVPLRLEASDAALLLGAPDLIRALRVFFELLWVRATPWLDEGRRADDELLTPVQHRVLQLLAADLSDEQVAGSLGVTTRTVRRHVATILDRLGVSTRFAAAVAAHRHGWLLGQAERRRTTSAREVAGWPVRSGTALLTPASSLAAMAV